MPCIDGRKRKVNNRIRKNNIPGRKTRTFCLSWEEKTKSIIFASRVEQPVEWESYRATNNYRKRQKSSPDLGEGHPCFVCFEAANSGL